MTNENLEMIKNIAIQWLHQDVKGIHLLEFMQ